MLSTGVTHRKYSAMPAVNVTALFITEVASLGDSDKAAKAAVFSFVNPELEPLLDKVAVGSMQ